MQKSKESNISKSNKKTISNPTEPPATTDQAPPPSIPEENQDQKDNGADESFAPEEPLFTVQKAINNLEDFFLRGKLIRDAIIKQCIFI